MTQPKSIIESTPSGCNLDQREIETEGNSFFSPQCELLQSVFFSCTPSQEIQAAKETCPLRTNVSTTLVINLPAVTQSTALRCIFPGLTFVFSAFTLITSGLDLPNTLLILATGTALQSTCSFVKPEGQVSHDGPQQSQNVTLRVRTSM